MAVDMQQVISKVEKLLALGTSSNEHEAALAVGKAQELLVKYGLDMQAVTGRKANRTDVRKGEAFDVHEDGKPTAWRMDVLRAVAKTSGVWIATGWRTERIDSKHAKYGSRYLQMRTAYLIGLPGDTELAAYAYSFLVGEIERLAQVEADRVVQQIKDRAARYGMRFHEAEREHVEWGHSHPLKVKASFQKGAAVGVAEMLVNQERERRQASADTQALVVNRDAAIRDWWYMEHYNMTWDEYKAHIERARAQADTAVVPSKPLTPAQRRKAEEKAEREYERAQKRAESEYRRKWANIDYSAYQRGQSAGREMSIRPGVKDAGGRDAGRIGQG